MIEEDPDVVRWGLHHLDVCHMSGGGSPNITTHYDKDSSQTEYVREAYCEAKRDDVENDEVIARAFQEELTKVAANEASGSSHSQAYVLAQEWHGSVKEKNNIEHGNDNPNEGGEGGKFEKCSSMTEESFGLEDCPYPPEIEDESLLDGEVGKRMNDMVPIPHVPKTNGEIPTPDEEVSDHQRLLDRLQVYELVELKVQGDGNCQFRALSDQIYRTAEHHRFVRQEIVEQLKLQPELYEGYVPMAYGDYLKQMSMNGQWGDHVTLQAAADAYGVKIFIITSFRDTCYIEILPHTPKSKRIIFLSFWAEVHYNPIYPEGEVPIVDSKKKRKWWPF